MQLCKVRMPDGKVEVAVREGDAVRAVDLRKLDGPQTLADVLHSADPAGLVAALLERGSGAVPAANVAFLPPVDSQEIWAAGVTYKRSKVAREEESSQSGGARFYDMVYSAPRPELFFKSPAWRAVGPGGTVRIRKDGRWNVPEPEVALVISPKLEIVGYTIGNDMSSRDIEGENPLYLPQAKFYDGACAVGPVVTLATSLPARESVEIRLTITRGGAVAFAGATSLAAMARTFEELVSWLGRETSFPDGALLLTGTGVVPPDSFTLAAGDEVSIAVTGIGTLTNVVG